MKIFPTIFLVALASRQVFATTSSETLQQKFRNESRFTLYNSRKLEGKCIEVCEPMASSSASSTLSPTLSPTITTKILDPTNRPSMKPTNEPTNMPEPGYKFMVEDKKCPINHPDRIDRIENMSREGCYELCKNTSECSLFSWGDEAAGQWKDICILCNSDLNLEPQTGFISYSMLESGTTKVTNEPVEERAHTDVGYKLNGRDKKCPINHSDRVAKHTDTTREGCYELCKNTSECSLFSWGDEAAGQWKDICILCNSDLNLEPETGFISYSMPP